MSVHKTDPAPKTEDENPPVETEDENPPADENSEDSETEDEGDESENEPDAPTLSHEQALDALKQTRTEAKNYRLRLRELEAQITELKTPEQVNALVSELKADREASERSLLIENVALKFKLPEALAKRLQGTTREEMEADAKTLATLIPPVGDEEELDGGLNPGQTDNLPADPGALARRVNRGRRSNR